MGRIGLVRIAQVAPLHEAVPRRFYGGTERVVSYLTENLVELGHDVTLFASGLEDPNVEARRKPERRQALQEAKQAVRTYAREPSRANADAVEMAWRKVRQLDSVAQWRQARSTGPMLERSS